MIDPQQSQAAELRKLLEFHKISQRQAAKLIRVSDVLFRRWLASKDARSRRMIPERRRAQLIEALNQRSLDMEKP
jgi:hypothetical protein